MKTGFFITWTWWLYWPHRYSPPIFSIDQVTKQCLWKICKIMFKKKVNTNFEKEKDFWLPFFPGIISPSLLYISLISIKVMPLKSRTVIKRFLPRSHRGSFSSSFEVFEGLEDFECLLLASAFSAFSSFSSLAGFFFSSRLRFGVGSGC